MNTQDKKEQEHAHRSNAHTRANGSMLSNSTQQHLSSSSSSNALKLQRLTNGERMDTGYGRQGHRNNVKDEDEEMDDGEYMCMAVYSGD